MSKVKDQAKPVLCDHVRIQTNFDVGNVADSHCDEVFICDISNSNYGSRLKRMRLRLCKLQGINQAVRQWLIIR